MAITIGEGWIIGYGKAKDFRPDGKEWKRLDKAIIWNDQHE